MRLRAILGGGVWNGLPLTGISGEPVFFSSFAGTPSGNPPFTPLFTFVKALILFKLFGRE